MSNTPHLLIDSAGNFVPLSKTDLAALDDTKLAQYLKVAEAAQQLAATDADLATARQNVESAAKVLADATSKASAFAPPSKISLARELQRQSEKLNLAAAGR